MTHVLAISGSLRAGSGTTADPLRELLDELVGASRLAARAA
jgi:hypothetical protein